MSFLKAEWRRLILVNYSIDPVLLKPYLPYRTELDSWNGNHYVSLVGFMFLNTRLLGVKVPFHIDFEEINLRFYVRYKDRDTWKRGAVFVKEIVPKPAITCVANTIYKEHYATRKMFHSWEDRNDALYTEYGFYEGKQRQSFSVTTSKMAGNIPAGSETEFITEHYWGYSRNSETRTIEYEVTHPKWLAYKVLDHDLQFDFSLVYGKSFDALNTMRPASVMLAEGSEITVESKRIIK